MEKRPKLLILFFAVALATLGVLYLRGSQKTASPATTTFNLPNLPIQAAPQISTVEAPDGSHILTMKEEKGKNAVTHTLSISTESDNSQKQIFSKTLEEGSALSIPPNTFSPDDKYVFLKETGKSGASYIVLTSSGAPITEASQTITFSDLFAKKLPDYKITDVTGWASPTLIVINTDKLDGTKGPSFWFEVPSQSFILLSTRFN